MEHLPARLLTFLQSLDRERNVLIPGCGQEFRTIDAFHRAGHRVTAIDFSAVAVQATKEALPAMANSIILGDFFTHRFQNAPFDLIYERTFLCALPPPLWKDYAARVAELLRPNGSLAGFFFYGKGPDPPPYPLTTQIAAEIFNSRFELETSEPVTDSLAIFGGQEKWQEWRLR